MKFFFRCKTFVQMNQSVTRHLASSDFAIDGKIKSHGVIIDNLLLLQKLGKIRDCNQL